MCLRLSELRRLGWPFARARATLQAAATSLTGRLRRSFEAASGAHALACRPLTKGGRSSGFVLLALGWNRWLALSLGSVSVSLRHLFCATLQAVQSRSIPPFEHPQRAQSIPTAGRTEAFQFEVRLALVAVLQGPKAVRPLAITHDVDGLGETPVARRADGLEIVESPENVVVPPRRESESKEYRLDDVAVTVGAEEPVHQKELTPAPLRRSDRQQLASTV